MTASASASIRLDTVWRARNEKEGRWVNRASAFGLEEVGDGPVICRLCRRLLEAVPHLVAVSVWRGKTLVFPAMPVERWAAITVQESGTRSARFVAYRPFAEGTRKEGAT